MRGTLSVYHLINWGWQELIYKSRKRWAQEYKLKGRFIFLILSLAL